MVLVSLARSSRSSDCQNNAVLVISAGLLCPKTARTPPCLQCFAMISRHSPDKQEHPALPTRVCRREGLRCEDRYDRVMLYPGRKQDSHESLNQDLREIVIWPAIGADLETQRTLINDSCSSDLTDVAVAGPLRCRHMSEIVVTLDYISNC